MFATGMAMEKYEGMHGVLMRSAWQGAFLDRGRERSDSANYFLNSTFILVCVARRSH